MSSTAHCGHRAVRGSAHCADIACANYIGHARPFGWEFTA